jgi:hypothetical protein
MEAIRKGGNNARTGFIRSFCACYCQRRYGANMQDRWVINVLRQRPLCK